MRDIPADIVDALFGEDLSRPQYIKRNYCDEAKRREALKRDKHTCVKCGSKKNLHVHHKLFDYGYAVDEVGHMETLCINCHGELHDNARSERAK